MTTLFMGIGVNNLKQIGLALSLYSEREGCYPEATGPAFLASLYQAGDCPDLRVFLCRGSGRKVTTGFTTDFVVNPSVAGTKGGDVQNPSVSPVVWESQPFHKGQIRCVLYMDGHVEPMGESAFQAMLAKGSP